MGWNREIQNTLEVVIHHHHNHSQEPMKAEGASNTSYYMYMYMVWRGVSLVVALPFLLLGLLIHTELIVSLFIRCTMRCEIWAQPAELPR